MPRLLLKLLLTAAVCSANDLGNGCKDEQSLLSVSVHKSKRGPLHTGEGDSQSQLDSSSSEISETKASTVLKTYGYSYDGNANWKPIQAEVDPNLVFGTKNSLHSQVGQDFLVQSLLGCQENGFFLELAAFNPERLSNSLMIERDFNWKGLCVEANPNQWNAFAPRKCTLVGAAVGSPTDKVVTFTFKGSLSGIVDGNTDNHVESKQGSKDLHIVALGDLLKKFNAPEVIDYFSLDVEGAESLVMDSFPWEKYTFKVLTVERPKDDLRAKLKNNGYEFLRRNSGFDDELWIHTASFPDANSIRKQWKNGARQAAEQSCMIGLGYKFPKQMSM